MRIAMTMCLWLTLCAPVPAQPATQPSAGGFALGEREKIVFVGDSITAAGQYVMYIEGVTVGDLHAPMALHVKTRRQDTPAFRMSGYAVFRKNYSGGADPNRAVLDERLQALCKPVSMAIRIAPTQ
ncbi:MAG: hypothetical protein NTY65_03315 [Planctomycetota bacterium]|nr:hypothetical protein [Planctomycetota bacterium]